LDQETFQFGELLRRRIFTLEAKDYPFQQIDQRVKGSVLVERRALALREPCSILSRMFCECSYQAGFTDSRLAPHKYDLSSTLHDLMPDVLELLPFGCAAYQWSQIRAAEGLQTRPRCAFAKDPVRRKRGSDTL